jgi:hypothetical protein
LPSQPEHPYPVLADPRIAEKIQERYAEIARLADEKRKALLDYDAKIEELESRIDLILQNGTDLII